jgi:histidine triad (HIT) family protein
MAGIFSRIVSGEIPAFKILEDKDYLAFLDVSPLTEGHTLVIPKVETDYIFDLDDHFLRGILPFSKKVAAAIKEAIPCIKVGISVIGLEVPHAHIHLIPINHISDMNFGKDKPVFTMEELKNTAELIISKL